MDDAFAADLEELLNAGQPLAISKLVALSSLDPERKAQFEDAWPAVEVTRRRRLIQELADLAEDNVELNFDAILLMALADIDAEIRRDAIRGLWEYQGRDLIGLLLGLLADDAEPLVRAEAALALGRFVLLGEYDSLRRAEVQRIGEGLRRVVVDEAEVVEVRARALESIGARSQAWVRDLIESALDGAERPLRLSAIHAMGRSCDTAWLPDLFDAAADDDGEVRFEAATALGAIADEAAVPCLVSLLDDDDEEVREAAIIALGEVASDGARQALEHVAANGDEHMREAALAALEAADLTADPLGVKARDGA